MSNTFDCQGYTYKYDDIRKAMNGENYPMSLPDKKEKQVVIKAVNMGIDSHLEACNIPDRGDSFVLGERSIQATEDTNFWDKGDKLILATTLECEVSPESLPVLLRRLSEDMEYTGEDGDDYDVGSSLASSILYTLGFSEGEYVGREALGLD